MWPGFCCGFFFLTFQNDHDLITSPCWTISWEAGRWLSRGLKGGEEFNLGKHVAERPCSVRGYTRPTQTQEGELASSRPIYTVFVWSVCQEATAVLLPFLVTFPLHPAMVILQYGKRFALQMHQRLSLVVASVREAPGHTPTLELRFWSSVNSVFSCGASCVPAVSTQNSLAHRFWGTCGLVVPWRTVWGGPLEHHTFR